MNIIMALIFVAAELTGAVILLKTKDTIKKILLSCVGLGFALAIVFADIIPDATDKYAKISPEFLISIVAGALCAYGIEKIGKHFGNYTAVLGFSFHNFLEGVVLTMTTSISPVFALGAILHKLPEGMASFSLLEGLKDRTKVFIAVLSALMIPLGALITIPENIAQPLMAFGAGVILLVVTRSFKLINSTIGVSRYKIATVTAIGAIIGAASCLIV